MQTKRKNAPAGVAAPTEARENGCDASYPKKYHSTKGAHALHIFDLLPVGRENALTLRELVALTGEDERTVRRRIHAERKGGKLILSDNQNGYFLPEDPSDVQRFIRSMNGRAREVAAISCAAEIALSEMTGQARMEGV
mgnify:CR=1 FL=1